MTACASFGKIDWVRGCAGADWRLTKSECSTKAQHSWDPPTKSATGREWQLPPAPRLLAVDRNLFHLPLRGRQFRQRDGEDAVLERRRNLVLIDIVDWDPPLETAVVALAEATLLVFGFALLLAADRQHAVGK